MPAFVLDNAFLSVNAVTLSDHVRSVTLTYGADMQDKTAMGDLTRTRLGGLKDWSLQVEWNQDHDAAEVDATLFGIVGTSVALILRPDAGVVSATNPEFTGNALLESYDIIAGAVGDVAQAPTTFQGDGTLARATS